MPERGSISTNEAISIVKEKLRLGKKDQLIAFFPPRAKRTIISIIQKIESGTRIHKMHHTTLERISDFHYLGINPESLYRHMRSIIGVENINNQKKVKDFIGDYVIFYKSVRKTGRLYSDGEISIFQKEDTFRYSHNVQLQSGISRHKGFVYYMENRLYFTGLGPDFTRPMLCDVNNKSVNSDIIEGTVMSITEAEHKIFSTKFMMINKDIWKAKKMSDIEIVNYLDNKSRTDNVIEV